MGIDANVRAYVARTYGFRDGSASLPAAVASTVDREVTRARSRGVLSSTDIERIAATVFDLMPETNQQFYKTHRTGSRNIVGDHQLLGGNYYSSNSRVRNRDGIATTMNNGVDGDDAVEIGDGAGVSPSPAAANNLSHHHRCSSQQRHQQQQQHSQPPFVVSRTAHYGLFADSSNQNHHQEQNNNNNNNNPPVPPTRELTYALPPPKPAVPRCGLKKIDPIRRHVAANPSVAARKVSASPGRGRDAAAAQQSQQQPQQSTRPASTAPIAVQANVNRYLQQLIRPQSQMQYATANSFRRLQRQKLDKDWNDFVQKQAEEEERERKLESQKRLEEKKKQAAAVRDFYDTKQRELEDKYLEREAERIEMMQWYNINTKLESRDKQEKDRRRKEEFETFMKQAQEVNQYKRREQAERKKDEREFRKEIERGVIDDKKAERQRFNEMRGCFLHSLKEGTEIAKRHREEEKRTEKEEAKKVVAEAKEVLATTKQREAAEKARRLQRVKKHEALQEQAKKLYEETVLKSNRERQQREKELTEKDVARVEEQYRQRRLNEKEHDKSMRSRLKQALRETVVLHEHQKAAEVRDHEQEKQIVTDAIRRENAAARKEAEAAREKREKLKTQQQSEITKRTQELLEPPQWKITEKKRR